ncbi:Methyl-CpG-binding domain protein 4 [Pelomyxa schiedti]|nr:Methyl-CpG-binding domain protein 4 [Pelomyxa schiedti]
MAHFVAREAQECSRYLMVDRRTSPYWASPAPPRTDDPPEGAAEGWEREGGGGSEHAGSPPRGARAWGPRLGAGTPGEPPAPRRGVIVLRPMEVTYCMPVTQQNELQPGLERIFPGPHELCESTDDELAQLLAPLGLQHKRSVALKQFSHEFLTVDWEYPDQLHGIGKYANDAYRMFCCCDWESVEPTDKYLQQYKQWVTTKSDEHVPPLVSSFFNT